MRFCTVEDGSANGPYYTVPFSSILELGKKVKIIDASVYDFRNAGIASNGNGYAVIWNQRIQSCYNNILVKIQVNGLWGDDIQIVKGANYDTFPKITSNGSGYGIVWEQNCRLYANTYINNNWREISLISLESPYSYEISSNGDGYAVMWESDDHSIHAIIYEEGYWKSVMAVKPYNNILSSFQIASNGKGYAIAWQELDCNGESSVYTRFFEDGIWGDKTVVEYSPGEASLPAIASDGHGYALAWRHQTESSNAVYVNDFDGVQWSSEYPLEYFEPSKPYLNIIALPNDYAVCWEQLDPKDTAVTKAMIYVKVNHQ